MPGTPPVVGSASATQPERYAAFGFFCKFLPKLTKIWLIKYGLTLLKK
jgi:hypothetical protein